MDISSQEVSETLKTPEALDQMDVDEISSIADTPSVISWGRSDFGGLLSKHGMDDRKDGLEIFHVSGQSIVSIASNVYHTAAVTATGELYTCGQNDQGQVSDDASITALEKPKLLESLSNQRVVSVACGLYHTCVVTASGCAISFGGNENGQLGHSSQKIEKVGPKVVNFLLPPRKVPLVISKVACGDLFSLFLTTSGEVYGCGSSSFLGNPVRGNHLIVSQAERIEALVGSNIINIAAGSAHSLALSISGDLYGWGSNKHNELGFDTVPSRDGDYHQQLPKSVPLLTDIGTILGISAGYSHSVIWTSNGLLFGSGNNKYGQLGINLPRANEFTLIKLPNFCTMAVCGSNHTLVLCNNISPIETTTSGASASSISLSSMSGASLVRVPSITTGITVSNEDYSVRGGESTMSLNGTKLFGFGANMMNQIIASVDATTMCRSPLNLSSELAHAWAVSEVLYVGAGGDHSFVIATTCPASSMNTNDLSLGSASNLSGMLLKKQFSTLVSKAVIPMTTQQLQNLIDKAQIDPDSMLSICLSTMTEVFSSPSLLSASFVPPNSNTDCIDVVGLENVFTSLLRLHSSALPRLLGAIQQSLTELERALETTERLNETSARIFAILWQAPLMGEAVLSADIFLRLMRLVYRHRMAMRRYLVAHGKDQYPLHIFVTRFIKPLQIHLDQYITLNPDVFMTRYHSQSHSRALIDHSNPNLDTIALFCKVLHVLYMSTTRQPSSVNTISSAEFAYHEIATSQQLSGTDMRLSLPTEAFHSSSLSKLSDSALVMDTIHWRETKQRRNNGSLTLVPPNEEDDINFPTTSSSFFYVSSFPYLLSVDAKRRIILAEAMLHQQAAQRQAVAQGILLNGGIVMPWFVLPIERAHLLPQTLLHIQNASPLDIKKPMKVIFLGEEGIDEGGVKKEFFQLLMVKLMDLSYGMFEVTATGRHLWVNKNNLWSADEYQLVGSILALAVYNNVILDVHLPLLFYKKLLQQLPVTLEDLSILDPQLQKGLQMLLDFPQPELVEDTFCRTFSVEYEVFGEKMVHDLIPDGRHISVTGSNRQEYVDRYLQWLLDESVASQFHALREGFSRVIPSEQLLLLTPGDLELLVAGMPHLDFKELEASTEYIGDSSWTVANSTISWFWQILHELPLEDKQRFLKFVTGSHKAPIGGLKELGLKIQRAGPDSNSLPTAHTCFNTLLLPEYSTEEKLKDRLLTAIHECEGFGLK